MYAQVRCEGKEGRENYAIRMGLGKGVDWRYGKTVKTVQSAQICIE